MSVCNPQQIILGLLALCAGVLVYMLDRNPRHLYFIDADFSWFQSGRLVFGWLGQHLPSFLHVFSFSVISAGVMKCQSRRCGTMICLVWLVIDAAFEIGQHDRLSTVLLSAIPHWFESLPLLQYSGSYFVYGTFDVLDLLFTGLGALAAWLVIAATVRRTYD